MPQLAATPWQREGEWVSLSPLSSLLHIYLRLFQMFPTLPPAHHLLWIFLLTTNRKRHEQEQEQGERRRDNETEEKVHKKTPCQYEDDATRSHRPVQQPNNVYVWNGPPSQCCRESLKHTYTIAVLATNRATK